MPEQINPLGAVVAGECQKKIAGVCSYPADGEIGAVLCFSDQYRHQYNVCKSCSDHLFCSGEWYLPGEAPPAEKAINRYFAIIHRNPTPPPAMIGIIVPMYANSFQGIPVTGFSEDEVLENIRRAFLDQASTHFQSGDELFALDRKRLLYKRT